MKVKVLFLEAKRFAQGFKLPVDRPPYPSKEYFFCGDNGFTVEMEVKDSDALMKYAAGSFKIVGAASTASLSDEGEDAGLIGGDEGQEGPAEGQENKAPATNAELIDRLCNGMKELKKAEMLEYVRTEFPAFKVDASQKKEDIVAAFRAFIEKEGFK